MPQEINAFEWNAEIDLLILSLNMIIGLLMGLILRFHFKKYGSVLSNRDELGQVLPLITLIIILIISVVKSSLALSLGLVGALSIVRFRTPIKEPEELAYLFLSIAVGLGLGAGQVVPTIVSFIIIIIAMTLIKYHKKFCNVKNMYLSLVWKNDKKVSKESELKKIDKILSGFTSSLNLRRYDVQQDCSELNYVIDLKDEKSLDGLINDLKKNFKNMNITFLDQNNMAKL